jgi:hypothetical protein
LAVPLNVMAVNAETPAMVLTDKSPPLQPDPLWSHRDNRVADGTLPPRPGAYPDGHQPMS